MSLRSKLKSSWEHVQYSEWNEIKEDNIVIKSGEKVCVFDMRHLVPGRRISQMYMQFTNIGFKCLFYYPNYYWWFKSCFLKNWNYWDIAIKKGTVVTKVPAEYDIVIAKIGKSTIESNKIIYFEDRMVDKIEECVNDNFFFPILFHPEKMSLDIEKKCLNANDSERKIGILFIGNNDQSYVKNTNLIHEKYGVHTRAEILESIKENLREFVFEPNSYEELVSYMESGWLERKIVIIDRFRLRDEYIDLLKQANYFICTTGVVMPFCHNHIESIACGCIPIIEFSGFYPELNQVSINFRGMTELVKICREICSYRTINRDEIVQRSIKVQNYYKNHWSFKKFEEKINAFLTNANSCDIYYVAENHKRF